ncbi:MAG TPA: YCF48-related protein [Egibacteraceae bacterium]|nr:YCF48-related protein [Egibacteraceae bacterium]
MASCGALRSRTRVPALVVALVVAGALLHAPAGAGAAGAPGAWTAQRVGAADLHAAAAPSGELAWLAGAGGTLLGSRDGGRTWAGRPTPTRADLHGLDFVGASTGWAVGADDTLVTTRDGGRSWRRTVTGAPVGSVLRGVDFVDATHGWVVGHTAFPIVTNVIATTTDGGSTWTRQAAPLGLGLRSVSFADRRHGFAGGHLGVAYRTADGGATWTPMVLGATGDVAAVVRIDAATGLAAVQETIYRTGDGGITWTPVAAAERDVRALAHAGGTAFAVGDGGLALRSIDGGRSWSTQPAGTADDLAAVSAPSPSAAVAAGAGGAVATYRVGEGPQPLDVAPDPEACVDPAEDPSGGRLEVRWSSPAAGYPAAAASGDLTGDGSREIVVAGPEGVRALRPGRPTAQATLWERPFQARAGRVLLADLSGDGRPSVVVAGALERPSRSGVLVLDAATGRTLWSRQLSGGASVVRAADVDGTGGHDLVVITAGNALHVLSGADGVDLRPPRALGARPKQLQVGDLDGDRAADAVIALADGRAVAVDLARDRVIWTYRVEAGLLETVVLADVTGDGRLEAVLGGRGTAAAPTSPGYGGTLAVGERSGPLVAVVHGADGRRAWDWAVAAGGTDRVVAVATGDLTGDGVRDVVAHVAKLGEGHLVAFRGAGRVAGDLAPAELLWTAGTTHGSGGVQAAYTPEGLVATDGDGDGVAEVYLSSWSGALLGVRGARPPARTGLLARPRPAERLFTVARQPPHTHVSVAEEGGRRALVSASGDHLVAVRDPVDGGVRWPYDAGGRPEVAPGRMGPGGALGVAVGSAAGRVFGLDLAGRLLAPGRDAFLPRHTVGVVAVDVTGDGLDEIVGATAAGRVAAVDPRTSAWLWETDLDAGVGAVAAAGARRVAIGLADGRVVALDVRDGTTVWQQRGAAPVRVLVTAPRRGWVAAGDAAGVLRLLDEQGALRGQATAGSAIVGAVAADLDGDGLEDFAVAVGPTLQGFSATGQRLWSYALGDAAAHLAAGDLSGDGVADVVGTGMDGHAHAVDGRTGSRLWAVANGWPGPVAVADLDGDGRRIAVVTSPAAPDAVPGTRHTVRTVDVGGRVLTRCSVRKAPHVARVVDLDGDGADEVVLGMGSGDVYAFGGRRAGSPRREGPDAPAPAPAAPPAEAPPAQLLPPLPDVPVPSPEQPPVLPHRRPDGSGGLGLLEDLPGGLP